MNTIRYIFGSPNQSDPLSRWIPYRSFVEPGVFRTKSSGVGMTIEMRGVEYETLTDEQIDRVAEKITQASRVFTPKFRVYHHLLKREGETIERQPEYLNDALTKIIHRRAKYMEHAGIYSLRIYVTILLETNRSGLPFLAKFSDRKADEDARVTLQSSVNALKDAVYSYAASIGDLLGVSVLDNNATKEFWSLLLNPRKVPVPAARPRERMDRSLGVSEIEKHTEHLAWGNCLARVFAMKSEPSGTFAHMLRKLLRIESNFTLSLEWNAESNVAMTHMIRGKRRRTFAQRTSAVSAMMAKPGEQVIIDEAATNRADTLNRAIAEMQTGGNYFGFLSLIACVFDQDEDRLRRGVADLETTFSDKGAVLIEEMRHRLRSFFAILPGNSALNIRYHYLLNTNYADLVPAFRPQIGSTVNAHLGDEYMTVFQSLDGTPFYFSPHVGQVAATLISGVTGSGKSMLVNQLITDSQKYEPITIVVDVGGSYRNVTREFSGAYVQVRLNQRNFSVNPVRCALTPENIERVRQLFRVFLANDGYIPTSDEDRILNDEIHALFGMREERRRLSKISLPKDLRARLHLWLDNGPYAHFFDNDRDDLQLTKFQTWDFTDLETVPQLLNPLMFYIFHWASTVIRNPELAGTPKGLWIDEGWRFGGTLMQELIRTAAKTWRKHNGWIVFATQDEEDLRNTGLLSVLNTSCLTKLHLPNPGANLEAYANSFKLNQRELELLREMKTGEMLITTARESRRVKLVKSPGEIEEYEAQFSAVGA